MCAETTTPARSLLHCRSFGELVCGVRRATCRGNAAVSFLSRRLSTELSCSRCPSRLRDQRCSLKFLVLHSETETVIVLYSFCFFVFPALLFFLILLGFVPSFAPLVASCCFPTPVDVWAALALLQKCPHREDHLNSAGPKRADSIVQYDSNSHRVGLLVFP